MGIIYMQACPYMHVCVFDTLNADFDLTHILILGENINILVCCAIFFFIFKV